MSKSFDQSWYEYYVDFITSLEEAQEHLTVIEEAIKKDMEWRDRNRAGGHNVELSDRQSALRSIIEEFESGNRCSCEITQMF